MSKKYEITKEFLAHYVGMKPMKTRLLKPLPYLTPGRPNFVTRYRDLSQLGTCYGSSYGDRMIFGDAGRYPFGVGKRIYTTDCYIFRNVNVPTKLARFMRS